MTHLESNKELRSVSLGIKALVELDSTSWEFRWHLRRPVSQHKKPCWKNPPRNKKSRLSLMGKRIWKAKRTTMILKVKRSNQTWSSSPQSNWKSSSKLIDLILANWLRPSKEDHPRMRDFSWPNSGTLMVSATKRLWMLGLWKWKIIYMPPRLDNIWLWNLPNPT